MLWYAELLIEAALALRLVCLGDGRRWFEALIVADLIVQIVQKYFDAAHIFGVSVPVFYIGQVIELPLTFAALLEASDRRRAHRRILFAWVAITMFWAWVRIFPYTGRALLVCNCIAFAAWLIDIARRRNCVARCP